MKKVTERIIALGDKKEQVTQDDLPYIISDVLNHDSEDQKDTFAQLFTFTRPRLASGRSHKNRDSW